MTSEFTVYIPKGTKIDGSTAEGQNRYAINGVLISPSKDPGRAWLTATDNRQLAALSVDAVGQVDSCIVPRESVKGASSIHVGEWAQSAKGSKRKPRTEDHPIDKGSRFPPGADVLPEADEADGYHWALLNPKLLRAMLDSIAPNGGNVAVGIGDNPKNPIVAVAFESNEAENPIGLGVLMRCSIADRHAGNSDDRKAEANNILAGQYRAIRNRYKDDETA